MEAIINDTRLVLVLGDITTQTTDAIVNAANPTLMGGGGVDGAIHRAGGPSVLDECKAIRARMGTLLPTGGAVITGGGNLKARFVIHTVGPVWHGGGRGEADLLASAYRNSLKLALDKGLTSVAFPSISTGAYGYPVEQAATVAMNAVVSFLDGDSRLSEVLMVLHERHDLSVYENALKDILKQR